MERIDGCGVPIGDRTLTSPDTVRDFDMLCLLRLNSFRKFIVVFRGLCTSNIPPPPPREARGLSRECVPPYPQRDRKRRLNGAVCRNHRTKRVVPCRC